MQAQRLLWTLDCCGGRCVRLFEPQRLARESGALGQGAQLGPGDLWMRAPAEAAVGAGDDVLFSDQIRVALQALRHELRVLHHVGGVGDHARNEDLAGGELHLLPHRDLVLVARIGALDQEGLRLHLQQEIDDVVELEIVGMRAVPASPAEMVAHAVFRDVAQSVVERLDAHLAVGAERLEPHSNADAIPQRGQPRIVDLQDQAGGDDGLVFDPHRLGEGEHILFVALVIAVVPIDLEAPRRRRREEHVLGSGGRERDVDLALEADLPDVSDGTGAGLHRAFLGDLRAGRIEQGAALGSILVEVGEFLAILALLDQRLPARRLDLGEAAEARLHVAQPVAALGILAFVDDIDPDLALPRDHGAHILGELRRVAGRNAVVERQEWQAADMRGENLCSATLHGRLHRLRDRCSISSRLGRICQSVGVSGTRA